MKISKFLAATLCYAMWHSWVSSPNLPFVFLGPFLSTTVSQWGCVNMAICMCVCLCATCASAWLCKFSPFRLHLSLKHLDVRDSKNQQSAKASLKCKFHWASFESLQFFQNNWAAAFWGLNLWSNLRLVSESSLSQCRQNWSAPSDLGVGDRIVLTDAWPAFCLSRFHCLFAFQEQHKAN